MTTVTSTDGLHLLCVTTCDIPRGSELLRDVPFLPKASEKVETLPEIPELEIALQAPVASVEGETFQGAWRGVKGKVSCDILIIVMLKRYQGDLLAKESHLLR